MRSGWPRGSFLALSESLAIRFSPCHIREGWTDEDEDEDEDEDGLEAPLPVEHDHLPLRDGLLLG